MFYSKNKKQRGFTLVELLIVITIIGILSGLAVVGMAAATDQARLAKAKDFAHAVENNLVSSSIGKYNGKVETVYSDIYLRDESGYKKDGRVWNGAATSSDTPFGSNSGRSSISFDGINDYVWITDYSTLPVNLLKPTDQLTISVFFKAQEYNKSGNWYSGLVSNYCMTGGSTGYTLGVTERGHIFGRLAINGGATTLQLEGNLPVSKSKWHHAALTYSNSDQKMILYLDGKKDSEVSGTAADGAIFYATYYGEQESLNIGRDPAVSDKEFNGLIFGAQVYSGKFEAP